VPVHVITTISELRKHELGFFARSPSSNFLLVAVKGGNALIEPQLTADGVVERGRKFPPSGMLDENFPYHLLCDVNFCTRFGSSQG
jgi:hypothetical protein